MRWLRPRLARTLWCLLKCLVVWTLVLLGALVAWYVYDLPEIDKFATVATCRSPGRFIWPSPSDGVVAISSAQLAYLFE